MKPRIYRSILFFITLTIVATIGLQLRWNIRNYYENRKQLISEIQNTFDKSVENYYNEKSAKRAAIFTKALKTRFPGEFSDSSHVKSSPREVNTFIFANRNKSADTNGLKTFNTAMTIYDDSIFERKKGEFYRTRAKKIRVFAEQVFARFDVGDSIDMKKFNRSFNKEFERRKIKIEYRVERFEDNLSRHRENPGLINVMANTTYLPPGQNLRLSYSDPTLMIFKRSLTEILLSLLLSAAIISCLLYLLYIINRQKKVDEIRNDLIANITHEFKTPITTVVSAIEGIRSFNENNDTEKTQRYLDISERQMQKLQGMVEKLLETATLDTDALPLQKEPVDLVAMLNTITEKYLVGNEPKIIASVSELESVTIQADAFHLENAISNIVDNAVKYGGQHIDIKLEAEKNQVCVFVQDDGPGIDSWHRERIFEKFYRIPTGNVHDVKGFGIGLYYSRKIIEKHDGSLNLESSKKTVFKITLPYA